MPDLDLNTAPLDMEMVHRLARRSAHVQHARVMLIAAGLTTLGILSIAGALLAHGA